MDQSLSPAAAAQHPITPPPLSTVKEWLLSNGCDGLSVLEASAIATQAARWGADQELEACCKLLELSDSNARDFLTSARRPKPPSLRAQALAALDDAIMRGDCITISDALPTLRRALEQLDD